MGIKDILGKYDDHTFTYRFPASNDIIFDKLYSRSRFQKRTTTNNEARPTY